MTTLRTLSVQNREGAVPTAFSGVNPCEEYLVPEAAYSEGLDVARCGSRTAPASPPVSDGFDGLPLPPSSRATCRLCSHVDRRAKSALAVLSFRRNSTLARTP